MTRSYIPNNLKSFRKRDSLRQQDVSEKLGLNSIDRISRWEKGLSIPSIINLAKLANLYHVSPQELYPELFKNPDNFTALD